MLKAAIEMQIMRCFAIIIIVILSVFRSHSYGQSNHIALKMSNVSLDKVLVVLEKKSDATFLYSTDDINNIFIQKLDFKHSSVQKILDYCLRNTNLCYAINGGVYVIRKKNPQTKPIKKSTSRVIKGKVVDTNNCPIPGATLVFRSTTKGTTTNAKGEFDLLVYEGGDWIVCSFVGMKKQMVFIRNKNYFIIKLEEEVTQMNEVVVTALGIIRKKEELGYSYSYISGKEITQSNESNLVNNLAGRMAGVQIMRPTGGVAASSRVIIRGVNSISGNNQPLYVIDGIPIVNRQFKNADNKGNGGIDSGDGISSISSNDIESVNVLKGAAATALYGSRAQNGVVIITTKKGKSQFGVDIDSRVGIESVLVAPNYQKLYGQGIGGNSAQTKEAARENVYMWGEKLGDTKSVFYDGQIRINRFYDNYERFYHKAFSFQNFVAIYNGNSQGNYRLSLTNSKNTGIIPNANYHKSSGNIRLTRFMDERNRWKLDAKLFYAQEKTSNRPSIGASVNNAARLIQNMPSTININWLKNYETEDERPIGFDIINSNPWWLVNKVTNRDTRYRVMGMLKLTYLLNSNWSFHVRSGIDFLKSKMSNLTPLYSPWYVQGSAREDVFEEKELNTDLLVSYKKRLGSDWSFSTNWGVNRMRYRYDNVWLSSDTFVSTDLQNASSGLNKYHGKRIERKGIDSVYGSAQITYNEAYFLELTGRNDWSSTLPVNNNRYFYPSISSSVLLSKVIDMPDWISHSRFRFSWAQVGGDTDPYQLTLRYGIDNTGHGDVVNGGVSSSYIPNSNLKPLRTNAFELGGNWRFNNDKINVDFSVYKQLSRNQIIDIPVSSASSYERAIVNAGVIENKGIESEISIVILGEKKKLKWDMFANLSFNRNSVESLHNSGNIYTILAGAGVNTTVSIEARKGRTYGSIVGYGYQRTKAGEIKLDAQGKPISTDLPVVLGNVSPKGAAGISNQFRYKNWSLNILLDSRWGGQLYSNSEATAYITGKHKNTLVGRAEHYAGTGFIPKGAINVGTEKNPVWEKNTVAIDPEKYYQYIGEKIDEEFVYSSDFIKLRELRLNYQIPSTWLKKLWIKSADISLVGRNLTYLYKAVENIDPESAFYTIGNGQGVEYGAIPGTRDVSFNISLKF